MTGDHPSILGNVYFDFDPTTTSHFMLTKGKTFTHATTATTSYATVLLENVSTPSNSMVECFGVNHPDWGPGH